ncbi:MAG: hypothetical protein ACKOJF_14475, partial [Planctomycetaceae bacterium]
MPHGADGHGLRIATAGNFAGHDWLAGGLMWAGPARCWLVDRVKSGRRCGVGGNGLLSLELSCRLPRRRPIDLRERPHGRASRHVPV